MYANKNKYFLQQSFLIGSSSKTGGLGRGDFQGSGTPLLKFLFILGDLAPLKLLHWLRSSGFVCLASKVLCSIVDCCMVIDASRIVDYTISVLKQSIIFPSMKIWAWLYLGHSQNVDVVVSRASLVKIVRNHHWVWVLAPRKSLG